jgi:DNA-binding PadR family transcriptional regulator
MSLPRSVAEVLREHVTLEVECIDRMYLNAYVPGLQYESGVAAFFRRHRGQPFASSALMDPISKTFVAAIHTFVQEQGVPLINFEKGQRKDDVMAAHLARGPAPAPEGIVFVGRAQEKARVIRTERRQNPTTGQPYPWLVRSTAPVNHFYFYGVDADFGPFFLKFGTYFPYNAKLCLNGHEYVKRQLAQRGIAFDALDNGILSCAEPRRLQALCDGLSAAKIDAFFRKWLQRLPHPFTGADRRAGYRYELSILQAEFSLTQVLDRPLSGRMLFENLIRENLDLGRPDRVQLLFDRRITRQTPGRFRTRVVTEGVVPSLHVSYKHSDLKQYLKGLRFAAAGRALRTELTVNDTRDFAIGRGLRNLAALRQVGFHATRRLLDVQRLSCDATIGDVTVERVHRPVTVAGQRAPGLRFLDPHVLALFLALVVFRLLPQGFNARELRQHLAPLLGKAPADLSLGQLTYDLRRLRLHGLIERLPKRHRYRVTDTGLRVALFVPRLWVRTLRPGLATVLSDTGPNDSTLRRAFERVEHAMDDWCVQAKLTA